jgi:Carboxypeptidase regulatory-like domain
MIRRATTAIYAVLLVAILPAVAHAQSAIVGVAKDTSGAVLPGVTVAASSDVLIEKTREVITDSQGAYKIVDLRPGTYVVTFTLTGFQTFRRENVELPAEFTSTINADLKVGAIEESVTVSAQSPIVDVTTAVHTQVLSREAIDSIPTGRTIQGMGQLIVGVSLSLPDTGGARAMQQTYMSTHGMTTSNTTVMVDGMMINGLQSDGAVQTYTNDAMSQEVSYQTSGINADTQAGGVRLNMIPREGGNRFSGDFKQSYRPGEWQGNNLTQRHKDKGLLSGNATDRIVDYTFAQGGPIKKDKLWFFTSARYISVNNFIPDTFYKDGSKGIDDQFIKSANARMTWQISPRNKFSAYFDEIDKYRGHDMQALFDPETAATVWYSPAYHTTSAKWTSPVTNRLLLEGGWSNNTENYTNSYLPGIEQPRGSAAWFANTSRVENDLGGRKTAATSQTTQSPIRFAVNASASYVTGTHNIKVGFQRTWGTFHHTVDANGDLTQQYRSLSTGKPYTVPDTVIIRNTPITRYGERLNYDLGIYAQDSWKMNRLTLNYGLRWEALNAQVEPADTPAGRFVPARHFEGIKDLPDWKDWAPRMSVVYDLFGNAKTALKYSVNRYNTARTTGIASDYNPLLSQTSTSLAWRDVNGDDIAQGSRGCDFGTNGLPGCEINFSALPANFGTAALNTYGNYPRSWNLEHGLELQHELMPQLSLTGSWFHGDFHNLTTTINQSWTFDGDPLKNPNYIPFTVFNPSTGEAITVYGRTAAAAAAPTLNLDTFDPERKRIYNAYSLEFRARPGRGSLLFGGLSFERQLNVNCTSPDNPNSVRFCDDRENGIPYNKNFKMAGSYPLPYGITISGSFQSQVGNSIRGMTATTGGEVISITRGTTRYPANCPAPCPAGAVILPASFQPATLTVKLVPDGTVFTERLNQVDVKISKTIKVGRVSILPTLEVFNLNNSDAVVTYVSTNTLAATYLRPNAILQGRIIGIGTTVRW